jgi:hypothetical protein
MGVDTSHKSSRGFQFLLYTFLGPTPAIVTPGAGVMPADSTTDYFRAGAWLGYIVRLARR